ncbi:MAG: ribonuclease P protein component [Proteobacteria bacterium]|uniref:ribonuclease P protein component n=1 Tax=Rudaea sp. TaxID=2136325 RepID=UPI0037852380|nr:ribonuclease P protein component [Pseudomonadota bacterium]
MSDSSPDLAYPRAARLLRPADFSALRHSGKRLSLKHLQCEYRPNAGASPRLGMAVSRRVSKLAVVRNRIRRQIRESFRLHRPHLPLCDVLVIARGSAAQVDNVALRAELEQLWRKLIAQIGNATASGVEPAAAAQLLNPAEAPGTMRDRARSRVS